MVLWLGGGGAHIENSIARKASIVKLRCVFIGLHDVIYLKLTPQALLKGGYANVTHGPMYPNMINIEEEVNLR